MLSAISTTSRAAGQIAIHQKDATRTSMKFLRRQSPSARRVQDFAPAGSDGHCRSAGISKTPRERLRGMRVALGPRNLATRAKMTAQMRQTKAQTQKMEATKTNPKKRILENTGRGGK